MAAQSTDRNVVLAVYEHQVPLDNQFKIQLFNSLTNDDQYSEIIQKLQDPEQANEVTVDNQMYKIKLGTLKVHEEGYDTMANYWRMVVPNDIDLTRMILHELHYVPYFGHPGFTRMLKVAKHFFIGNT